MTRHLASETQRLRLANQFALPLTATDKQMQILLHTFRGSQRWRPWAESDSASVECRHYSNDLIRSGSIDEWLIMRLYNACLCSHRRSTCLSSSMLTQLPTLLLFLSVIRNVPIYRVLTSNNRMLDAVFATTRCIQFPHTPTIRQYLYR